MLTPEHLEQRLSYVTGSDASIICGLNPYKTRLSLWLEKTRREVADDISHLNHIKFGNYMEDGVAQWFEAESGKKLKPNTTQDMLIHQNHPWMTGNVDRVLLEENAILECKTALMDDGWGDKENIIPNHYLLQVAHYCAVGNFDRAYIAVVFTQKREMRWYTYERNEILENKLIEKEREFWFNYVLADVAPEPVNSNDILSFFKEIISDPVIADSFIEEKYAALLSLQQNIKTLENNEKNLKEELKLYMQEYDTLLDNSGKILATWKYSKPVKRFDQNSLKKELPDIYSVYAKEGEKQRRFVLK